MLERARHTINLTLGLSDFSSHAPPFSNCGADFSYNSFCILIAQTEQLCLRQGEFNCHRRLKSAPLRRLKRDPPRV